MAREVKEDVILEISRQESLKGNPIVLRVVRWNDGEPKIEKRSFWVNEEGVLRTGKNLGLTSQDFETLIEKQDEVRAALSGSK